MRTVPVTTRALEQRVNRALHKDERMLKKCKESSRWYHELGDYYVVDWSKNIIVDKQVDIEELAEELEVLKPYEKIVEN